MRIVLAGASGLIGTALRASLRAAGHSVTVLVRRPARTADEARWAPQDGRLDPTVLAGTDAVVCLAGAGIGDHRWSEAYQRTLVRSRVDPVATLTRALVEAGGPRVFLAASAVGYYGDTGDREVTESAGPGSGFLAELCVRWEAAAAPARDAGVRVVPLRTGLVLSGDGGLLKRLRPLVRAGVAGRLGSGRQFLPWILLADEVRAIQFLLEHEVSGPANLTGPAPVRNVEFMAALGRVLHRPTVLPTPGFALRIALGEFASDVLAGQRALPAKLLDAGFRHEHAELESALRWALGR